MAQTGVVKKPFPYSADGVNMEQLQVGQVLSFPDRIFAGLSEGDNPYIEASEGEPENSATEAAERDSAFNDDDRRLMGMSDQELKDIIARSGQPLSGNLVHAEMVARAKAQITRERAGKAPITGVDPNSGVTEQPLAKPGEATPNSAAATVERQQAQAENVGEGDVKPSAQRPQEYSGKQTAAAAETDASAKNQLGEETGAKPNPRRAAKK